MTILMTFFGTVVFVFSTFTVGFKSAAKRLLTFAGIGALIDIAIIIISVLVTQAVTL